VKSRLETLKSILKSIVSLLTLVRYVPFLGKWREVAVALAALLGGLVTVLEKCDVSHPSPPPAQTVPTQPTSTPTPIPTRTPSPTPSPKPTPLIIVPERIAAGEPFLVKITSKFDYGVKLYVERFELCTLGEEYKTRHFTCTVTLWTAGKRKIWANLPSGKVEAWIHVQEAGPRAQ
jgi:hypothetical protein